MEISYIANQLTEEGLDEVQRLFLANQLRQNVALCGPPGVGKSDLIVILSQILGSKLLEITCDERMTESPLVGYPVLEGNGSTRTGYKNGVMTKGLVEGSLVYLDEFDQLSGSIQKRGNSANDGRRRLTRRDGVVVISEDADDFNGFIKGYLDNGSREEEINGQRVIVSADGELEVIVGKSGSITATSYNPNPLGRANVEDSVADRFVNHFFGYLPDSIEAAIALRQAGLPVTLQGTETRGVYLQDGEATFLKKDGGVWKGCWDEKLHAPTGLGGLVVYQTALKDSKISLETGDASLCDLALQLAKFNSVVRLFADYGTTRLEEEVKGYLTKLGDTTLVRLHKPSPRTLQYAIAQAKVLNAMGMPAEAVKHHATKLEIDQICYGSYRNKIVTGDVILYDALTMIAEGLGLLPREELTTSFTA